jgi:hypothetical protein
MKYPYVVAALAIASLWWVGAPGFTETINSGSKTPSSPAPEDAVVSVTGMVLKLDPANDSLKIKDTNGNVKMVTVDGESKIFRNGKPIGWKHIKHGDVLTILNPKMML